MLVIGCGKSVTLAAALADRPLLLTCLQQTSPRLYGLARFTVSVRCGLVTNPERLIAQQEGHR
ncbi:hypothetical protein GCM10010971_09180 [Silvimonas amylolytica]|uniref:Uncharacterized protein n=1 Tax=Silvimonas amylolytica TaxID=449663 RepID=A0ABQ2PHL9_9NEIS|nr:hypothetical protein GCM10010971_09180 [Silvimonas amylolytica]